MSTAKLGLYLFSFLKNNEGIVYLCNKLYCAEIQSLKTAVALLLWMNWKQNKPKYGWAALWKTKVVFVEWQRSFVNFNEIKTVLFRVKIVSAEWQCYFYSSGNRHNHNRSSLYIIIQNKGKGVVGGVPTNSTK